MEIKVMGYYVVLFLLATVGSIMSTEEDMELERLLKILNKPGSKIITTDYGDIFNCVDIHNQPSLDHPLLRNHKVQMEADYFQRSVKVKSLGAGLGRGCPTGTVPIRRVEKEDLIKSRALSNLRMKNYSKSSRPLADSLQYQVAVQKTDAASKRYSGGQAYFNIYSPTVSQEQFSRSLMYISSGSGELVNTIIAGWSVKPSRYGDSNTHLYTFWTADSSISTGCEDVLCPGFIQVDNTYSLGSIISPTSTYHGDQHDLKIAVSKDETTGNWWLTVGTDNIRVGYWPAEVFTDGFGDASEVKWGGEVYSPNEPSPPMGSGHFPAEDFKGACYIKGIGVQENLGGEWADVKAEEMSTTVDNPACYDVGDVKNLGTNWGPTFYFGGPGGQC